MSILLKRLFFFGMTVLLSFLVAAVFLYFVLPTPQDEDRTYLNSETESNLLIIPRNETFDFVMLGISHARNISRYGNHERVQGILGKRFLNLGQGSGLCGLNEQQFYLDYFFSRGNRTETVVIVMSAPLFLSDHLNNSTTSFTVEPVDYEFLARYINFPADNKLARVKKYLTSKLIFDWRVTYRQNSRDDFLVSVNTRQINEGLELAYVTELEIALEKNKVILERMINLARANGAEIMLITPPTLVSRWPGEEKVSALSAKLADAIDIMSFDFSRSLTDPGDYYDHHHLNSRGVDRFAKTFLFPVLSSKE